MKHLSLKAVLIGLMATLMIAIVALSATSLRSINTIGASTQELGGYWFERIVSAREVKGAFADLRLAYARYALVSDDAEFQAEAKPLGEAVQKLDESIAKYEAGIKTETGKVLTDKIKASLKDYEAQGSHYTELVRVGSRAEARDMFQSAMKARADQTNAVIEELVTFITDRAQSNVQDAEATADSAFLMTIAVASAALRGGSVCLNSFGRFAKWISASIMPPPSLVSAR